MNLQRAEHMIRKEFPVYAERHRALDLATAAIHGFTFRDRALCDAQQACEDAGLFEIRTALWAFRTLLRKFPGEHARLRNSGTLHILKLAILRARKEEAAL